jgi:hypothetical protein
LRLREAAGENQHGQGEDRRRAMAGHGDLV